MPFPCPESPGGAAYAGHEQTRPSAPAYPASHCRRLRTPAAEHELRDVLTGRRQPRVSGALQRLARTAQVRLRDRGIGVTRWLSANRPNMQQRGRKQARGDPIEEQWRLAETLTPNQQSGGTLSLLDRGDCY